ncbi:MAG: aspartate/glutamate racemase family protein [Hyphomicrobiaceae bacterium]
MSQRIDGGGRSPTIGVLKLDTRFERFIGDIGNPGSLTCPVLMETVSGATADMVTGLTDERLLQPFVDTGQRLIDRGAHAITTTCGFLVLYQRQLAAALSVPVATSSLLQIPLAQALLPPGKRVGVITFDATRLGPHMLRAANAPADTPVAGLAADSPTYQDIIGRGRPTTSEEREAASLAAADELRARVDELGAVVVECTNLAPYSTAIADRLGMPVYDTITLVEWLATAVRPHVYEASRSLRRTSGSVTPRS